MPKKNAAFFFRFILLLIGESYFTQPLRAQLFNFKTYSLDDGLSQSQINCIYEDSRGYLWLGTAGGGLDRFDGKEFKVYEQKDGLCGSIINAVWEDEQHNILVGTEGSKLCKFDGVKFSQIDLSKNKNVKVGPVVFITTDDNGNSLLANGNQLLISSKNGYELLEAKNAANSNQRIQCFYKDSRDIVWIGTNDGLLVLKNHTLLKITDAGSVDHANITSVTEDINGNICVVENHSKFHRIKIVGPSHYQVKEIPFDPVQLPEKTAVTSLHFDRNNQLWIGTANRGLFKFSNNELLNFNESNGLPVDNVQLIFEDKAGVLWFGTSGGGIVKFTNQAFTYFDNQPGMRNPDIFAIDQDRNGNIWVGTSGHGIFRYNGTKVDDLSAASKIGELNVRCIFTDRKNTTWIGTSEGIVLYKNSTFSKYSHPECKNVRALYEDSKGNMWIGTRGNGAFMDDGKSLRHIATDQNLTNENIYSFVQENDSTMWMGSGNGIYRYSNGKILQHLVEGLCNSYAGSLVKDKFNHIWVGTDNCVAVYKDGRFTSFDTKDGLASGTVYLLNVDSLGSIWVGTNKGIDKIVLSEKGEIESIRNYGKNEGFKGIECNSRSTCLDNQGNLWFGTIKGIVKFNPKEELMRQPESPIVQITGVKLFYEKLDPKNYSDSLLPWNSLPYDLHLPYDKNHISFEFSAISKSFPDNMRFSFILQGFDKEWSPPLEMSSATYSNLPPGKYKFIVKAINKDGVVNKEEQEYAFVVLKPFWITWWFITICLIGLIGFIYSYNEFRKRKHERYLSRLEKIIKERTAEIIRQRDENEILLKEVHHRVKNNLQIINSLINIQSDYVTDPKALELFKEILNRIRTISLVHEKLYKSDDYGNINVKEYIHMLVENLIETYSYDDEISLKLDLDVEHFNLNTIIPLGLLLNEIISNSFKYAFAKEKNGILTISLKRIKIQPDIYRLQISDNGAGYDNALFKTENKTLGLELIRILADQLNGKIEKLDQAGTVYQLEFSPLKD